MNYYESIKVAFEEKTKALRATISTLESQASKIEQRISEESSAKEKLDSKLEKLRGDGAFTGGEIVFEKFKEESNRLKAQSKSSGETIQSMTDEILPDKLSKIAENKELLAKAVSEVIYSYKPCFNKRLTELFGAFEREADDFFDAVKKVCSEFNVSPKLRSLAYNGHVGRYRLRVTDTLIELSLLPPYKWPAKQPTSSSEIKDLNKKEKSVTA